MAARDRLLYFDARARGEAVRMMYTISGTPLNDERIGFDTWPSRQAETPTGKIPVLYTMRGDLNESNTIARYTAKRFGMFGKSLWEEALHDMIMENVSEAIEAVMMKVYVWMILQRVPKPENTDEVLQEVKDKWESVLKYVQKVAEQRGKKFIVSNKIGLADIWLFTGMELTVKAIPDVMSLTPWTRQFVQKFKADKKVMKHLITRPESPFGL